MKRLYLDTCCLQRPFDDQTQLRIKLETDAVHVATNQEVEDRTLRFEQKGILSIDAIHLAMADTTKADYFNLSST